MGEHGPSDGSASETGIHSFHFFSLIEFLANLICSISICPIKISFIPKWIKKIRCDQLNMVEFEEKKHTPFTAYQNLI